MKWLTHGHATRLWQWQKAGYYLLWSDALSWCHPFAWLATRSNSDFSLMSPGTNTRLVNGMTCMLPKFLPFNIRAIFVTHLVMLGCLSGRISGYVHLIYFKTSKGWCHRFMGWYFFFFLVHYFCPWKLFLHLILCCLALERAAHYLLETNVLFQSFFF